MMHTICISKISTKLVSVSHTHSQNHYIKSINFLLLYAVLSRLDYRVAHCSPGNLVCAVGNAAIFSVSLSGEQNTRIQDDTKTCSSTNNYNDQSNLAVTLFDNTPYTLHIELSCVQQSGYDNTYSQDPYVFGTDCRDARYLGVWIDLNNDGAFDESTERMVPNNWYKDDPRMTQND
ncbi:unnamed protein product, partial [Rotaria sp. Silwood2]